MQVLEDVLVESQRRGLLTAGRHVIDKELRSVDPNDVRGLAKRLFGQQRKLLDLVESQHRAKTDSERMPPPTVWINAKVAKVRGAQSSLHFVLGLAAYHARHGATQRNTLQPNTLQRIHQIAACTPRQALFHVSNAKQWSRSSAPTSHRRSSTTPTRRTLPSTPLYPSHAHEARASFSHSLCMLRVLKTFFGACC